MQLITEIFSLIQSTFSINSETKYNSAEREDTFI